MVYVQVYVPGMERILQHFSWTRPYSHHFTARSRILSIHLPTTFISPQKAETLLRKMNVWIQWHDTPKIQRLADWQHPIFFGQAPIDGLDVQMDVRLLANQIRRSFSQRSQPEELIEERDEMRDPFPPPRVPHCELLSCPISMRVYLCESSRRNAWWTFRNQHRGWECSWLTVLNSSLCFCGALASNIWASNSGLICPQSSCAK